MSNIPKKVETRSDAEKCVKIEYREYLSGSRCFVVQLVFPVFCDLCGGEELKWKDMKVITIKEKTKESYKEAKAEAVRLRLDTIELLLQNTPVKVKEVR
jgi:hypothetical protein